MSVRSFSAKILTVIGVFVVAGLIMAVAPAVKAETGGTARSVIIGTDEVVVRYPVEGRFALSDYNVCLVMPEQWRDSVVLAEMPVTRDESVRNVYGLLFYPADTTVQAIQYLGVMVVYDRAFCTEATAESGIKLGETADSVFVFYNSQFNQYDNLDQALRFNELMLSDAEVARLLKIEKLATP